MRERRPIGTVDESASGGRCELIGYRDDPWYCSTPAPDLTLLETYRNTPAAAGPLVPASADGPFFTPGQVITWHFRLGADVARVVRDDERGLVCWIPGGSPRLAFKPMAADAVRELPLAERLSAPGTIVPGTWNGYGVLRIAPTGMPWSIWWFWGGDGTFLGWYVNLELPHQRPAGMVPGDEETGRVHTRDLVLDLWLEGDEIWLKDEDELEAAVACGRFTAEQAQEIRRVGDQARTFLSDPDCWVMTEKWEEFRPSTAFMAPVEMPDNAMVRAALAGDDA